MRLLLVTTDPSLGVVLAFDDPDREVVVAGSVADARERDPGSFDACVVDVGSTARGVRIADVLRAVGLADVLVIAERGEPTPTASRYRYLQRPFTVAELDAALRKFAPSRFRRSPHQTPRRRFLGRLFEAGGSPAQVTQASERPGSGSRRDESARTTPTDETAAVVESLDRRADLDASHLSPERIVRAAELAELLATVTRIERIAEERSHVADLEETGEVVTRRLSDALAAVRISLWMRMSDGSHVRLPVRGSGSGGPARLAPGHPLLDLLASSADGVRIDRLHHPWLDGVTEDIAAEEDTVAIAAALRIGGRYDGAVIAFGRGFTTADRDRLADLAWEAGPELALAAALERLGSRDRLFGLGALAGPRPH